MFRTAIVFASAALFCVPAPAEEKKPTVTLSGRIDKDLEKEMPTDGVIVSPEAWEKLVKAWGIKDAPKVDFTKEFLVVVGSTSLGSRLMLEVTLDEKGNLQFGITASTADLPPPGFSYAIKSVSRTSVKTVNGKELPKA